MPLLTVVNVVLWRRYLDATLNPGQGEHPISYALRVEHLPVWLLAPAAALLAAGLVAQVWSVWTLSARRALPVPVPVKADRPVDPPADPPVDPLPAFAG